MLSRAESSPKRTRETAGREPLALDLDHALLKTDLLFEAAAAYLSVNPLRVFRLLIWLLQGKAVLKRQLSERVALDVESLPVNEALIAYARRAKRAGRQVGIASASDELLAHRLAKRFNFIDFVVASDGSSNLKGRAKAAMLTERFPHGFAYAGDSRSDLAVWKEAEAIILAGASPSTTRAAERLDKPIEAVFPREKLGPKGWLKAVRAHQWAKNLLVFVPLVLAGMAADPAAVARAFAAFAALSMMASGTYLLNDLFDLADDRRHWSKKARPLAAGTMRLSDAMLLSPALVLGSYAIGLYLGWGVTAILTAYMATTLAYSIYLKRQPIADAFTLALLFTLRLGLGIVAVGAEPSAWLLVFSMFLFTSLSFAKRQTEIQRSGIENDEMLKGRGYRGGDAGFVLAMGVATGMTAVTIMVLYIINDAFNADFYNQPLFLWAFPAVLFMWISRIWLLCHRGELNDDPVAFALRDRVSIALGGVMAAAFLAGWLS
ncbi:Decaprenyl-phosphate phosphoribosyltransferase [Methyloligella halotolerans]|uniref:Decaprenyl-phosphate phosphoribosyltransferase n=1 Tax=Methyloligella halotolerans TaxID=1177755 RepID=A0A1E2S138_9HYPH|nr:UbiA family prenyltransferase [Methyloligella halotolerans]ODA68197.1 Decaprenyl-phosphate phosphoribosyltransferase [Methyloligella halotolerans]